MKQRIGWKIKHIKKKREKERRLLLNKDPQTSVGKVALVCRPQRIGEEKLQLTIESLDLTVLFFVHQLLFYSFIYLMIYLPCIILHCTLPLILQLKHVGLWVRMYVCVCVCWCGRRAHLCVHVGEIRVAVHVCCVCVFVCVHKCHEFVCKGRCKTLRLP